MQNTFQNISLCTSILLKSFLVNINFDYVCTGFVLDTISRVKVFQRPMYNVGEMPCNNSEF